jgi:hypothetical protein
MMDGNGRRYCIVGSTGAAMRAAFWLALQGAEVRWLRPGANGDIPWDFCAWPVPASLPLPGLGRGTVVDSTALPRALCLGGREWSLPLRRRAAVELVGRVAASDWLWARLEGGLAGWMGSRRRLATAREELLRAVGPSVYGAVYRPYWIKRWGADPSDLPANLAEWLHGRSSPERWWVPADDEAACVEAIRDAGGDVIDGVHIEALEVEAGRVVAVQSDVGREVLDAELLHDLPPHQIAALLPVGFADAEFSRELRSLRSVHAVEVIAATSSPTPFFVRHIVDASCLAWRIVDPSHLPGGPQRHVAVTAHCSSDDPLWLGDDRTLAAAVLRGVQRWVPLEDDPVVAVRRTPYAVPVPSGHAHREWVRRRDALLRAGIVGIGSRGAHQPLTCADEAIFLRGLLAGSANFPVLEGGRAHLRTFVVD